ncbi:hypothetical protein FZEAL_9235 [Fusarium zealandicum]|uniref:GATA-type domain-containing protein n=1 Tax=Fusarium zealandicum TaxID=1053134 RepID=A0A8H4XG17_9HYPO|nr:hypothetical protein FZEAL_9235 [Fusarium zealandicum]
MSLNIMSQSDCFDSIREHVDQLVLLTGQLPGYGDINSNSVTEGDLSAISTLSGDIITQLIKVSTLRDSHQDVPPLDVDAILPLEAAPIHNIKRKRRNDEPTCDKCGRIKTPEWRDGPEGPDTLCNENTSQDGTGHEWAWTDGGPIPPSSLPITHDPGANRLIGWYSADFTLGQYHLWNN